jgi:RecG-like helicase
MKDTKVILVWVVFIVLILGSWFIYKSEETTNVFSNSGNNVEKKEPTTLPIDIMSISQINGNMKGQEVKIKGTIVNKTEDKKGNMFLVVTDETGEISIPVFSDKKIDKQLITLNKLLYFSGKVDVYEGKMEIIPQSQNDISVIQGQDIKITKDNIGKEVILKGKVISKYNQAAGDLFVTISNTDTNEEVSVPIFEELSYNSQDMPTNSMVSIKGEIAEYKGGIEVIPEKTEDIKVLIKGDESKLQFLNIGDITENDRGKMINSNGYITDVTENKGNMFFSLVDQNDNSKIIKGVMFHAETKELEARRTLINNLSDKQSLVWLIAMVEKYDGKLELIIDKIDYK